MERVISADGTTIAYRRGGTGPPLLLVHGTTGDHARWAPLLPALEARHTVYALDRRGRGASGDAPSYAIEREYDDVAAVIDAIGAPVDLFGHSFGAICALEAACRAATVRRLVLYEPPIPIPPGPPFVAREAFAALQARLGAGDRDGALALFFREVVGISAAELAGLRAGPAWPARVAAAHTLTRELRAADAYVFAPESRGVPQVPTMLLLGGDSPPFFRAATEALAAALPAGQVVVLPGQQHTAMNTAPDLFLRTLDQYLAGE